MIPIGSAAQVRALDTTVINDVGIPGLVLMELAGRGAAEAIHERWPEGRVTILCGPGNNGGDGYVVARWLALWKHPIQIWAPRPPGTEGARRNAAWCALQQLPMVRDPAEAVAGARVVVDAMLGTGQRSSPRGALLEGVEACRQAQRQGSAVVALDLPTGLHADTGQALGGSERVVQADLTVTFGRTKPGLLCAPGLELAGEVVIIDIGLDLARIPDPAGSEPDAYILEATDIASWLPPVSPSAAKWNRGHVAIRAGGGAAVLAAHGAFRAGAGLVTLLAPRASWPRLHGLWPEVILAEPDTLSTHRHDALVLGPGLGLDARDEALALWSELPLPLVADADALTLLAQSPALGPPAAARVITPHSAEAARLLGCSRSDVEADRFASARALSRFGVALLKGPSSLIAALDLPLLVNPTGCVRLATAGSGDVLAGMVGAFLARNIPARQATAIAAWLHGRAGEAMPANGSCRDLLAAIPAQIG